MKPVSSNEQALTEALKEALLPLGASNPDAQEELLRMIDDGFFSRHQSKGRIDSLADEVLRRLFGLGEGGEE